MVDLHLQTFSGEKESPSLEPGSTDEKLAGLPSVAEAQSQIRLGLCCGKFRCTHIIRTNFAPCWDDVTQPDRVEASETTL